DRREDHRVARPAAAAPRHAGHLARPPLPAGQGAGLDRHAGDRRRVRVRRPDLHQPRGARRGGAPGARGRVGLRAHGRRRRADLPAGRPPERPDDPRGHRRLDADPPLLRVVHGVRPRLHAVLRLPELLRLLDAAAGPGRQLHDAHRRVGVRG
ncbi:MAG: NADH-ubiquinone oxidoreductase chain L, partial [uncultured Solirubrobacteraceae bacterium]